ncbi:MAG TPA: hypothetical protein VHC19_24490 [Pirellulales bacterium]|nr:hypothetical protein [Pirellulales bacterium]
MSASASSSQAASKPHPDGKLPLFSEEQWRELLAEDRVALGSVSMLLMSIVGVGMLGVMIVVAIMTFL